MNISTGLLSVVAIFFFIVFFVIVLLIGVGASYRNGVRDGYQNTWLPHVREQIEREGLVQGKAIDVMTYKQIK